MSKLIKRQMTDDDRALVYNSWMRSFRDPNVGSPITFLFDRFAWMEKYEGSSKAPIPDELRPVYDASFAWRKNLCKTYSVTQSALIDSILKTSRVTIACFEDAQDEILSWICFESFSTNPVVHYVYTKGPYRRKGFAKYLLEPLFLVSKRVRFTHWTPFALHAPHNWVYSPLCRERKRSDDEGTDERSPSCGEGEVCSGS